MDKQERDIADILRNDVSDEEVNAWFQNNTTPTLAAPATSTTEVKQTPEETTVTKTVVEPSVKPYSSNNTPFGEIRQPTGLESLFGINPSEITAQNKRSALGQDKNGVFEANDFYTAHPDFNVTDYLKQAIEAKNQGDYSLSEEGIFDKINKFFTAPIDEAKTTEKAYANNAFDNKIQNLIDDIVIYDSFQNQLLEANANNTMPKVRADTGLNTINPGPDSRQFRRLVSGKGYKRPESKNWGNVFNDQYKILSEMGKDHRKEIEKDIYRKLAEINRQGL